MDRAALQDERRIVAVDLQVVEQPFRQPGVPLEIRILPTPAVEAPVASGDLAVAVAQKGRRSVARPGIVDLHRQHVERLPELARDRRHVLRDRKPGLQGKRGSDRIGYGGRDTKKKTKM